MIIKLDIYRGEIYINKYIKNIYIDNISINHMYVKYMEIKSMCAYEYKERELYIIISYKAYSIIVCYIIIYT